MNASPPSTATDPVPRDASPPPPARIALLGNPNTGKTTVFNRLCGIRAKTANFPGSTVEARIGVTTRGSMRRHVVDLPGLYGLNLDRPESRTCKEYLRGRIELGPPPEAILVVVDATNLERNLILVSQAVQLGLPALVALNMTDLARRRGVRVDHERLAARVGCPVVPICARTGEGFDELFTALDTPRLSDAALPNGSDTPGATRWATATEAACVEENPTAVGRADRRTDRIDAIFTHPILGLLSFVVVMSGLFYTIFSLATLPMDLIELLFAQLGGLVGAVVPAGPIHDLLVDGVVSGVAGTLVFLPQICLLFFLISLLEDTGYLSRAVFVLDRLLRRFGLPGQAFVPLLSAHACAIPAIMSARLIPDLRQRIATILVAPLMSCSARLPVYVLLVGILFPRDPLAAGLAFTGCYALGAIAGLVTALVCRRTILSGSSPPMLLELPTYKLPSLRTALTTTMDR
ncbi:MAG: ferrous iron transporter B, partial [Phycisphaerales bacterium]|nr:ferrous iron transporter B [Phycisphaerales bacterium]